jgi:6-methylsalicylate decarboxylase
LLDIVGMSRIDVHQHFWPQGFVELLARRARPPLVRRDGEGWCVRLDGEPDAPIPPSAHHPVLRAEALAHDRVDVALLCMSSPLGVEALPAEEARPLLDAWHDGVLALDGRFRHWGAIALDGAVPADVDAVLDRGALGLSLPAGALSGPERLGRIGPLLEALERRHAPLLVHPGPGLEDRLAGAAPVLGLQPWWPALAEYPAQLQAAWLAFAAAGRREHPGLRVVFAALAGCAPLHAERIAARGGPVRAVGDPLTFYDTSSYGPRAVDAMVRVTGVDVLVHGSDRPVAGAPADHGLGRAATAALRRINPARLLGGATVGPQRRLEAVA